MRLNEEASAVDESRRKYIKGTFVRSEARGIRKQIRGAFGVAAECQSSINRRFVRLL